MNYYSYYYTDKNGEVVGPVSGQQLQELVDSGLTPEDSQACYEGSTDWKPLSAFIRPTPKLKATDRIHSPGNEKAKPSQPLEFRGSSLAQVFVFLGAINFAAGLMMLFWAINSPSGGSAGLVLFATCIGSSLFCFAIAKVIQCLEEMVFRLRNLERLNTHLQNSQKD